jgi:Flp pilus assembly protein TadB
MGVLGSIAKAIVIYTCIFWIFAIVSLLIVGQTVLAVIATLFFIIPLYMVISDHLRMKKTQKAQ